MLISKKSIKKIWYTILIFLLIFNPPIVKGISFTIMIVIWALFVCILNINEVLKIIRKTAIGKFVKWIVFFTIYAIIVAGLNVLFNMEQQNIIFSNIKEIIVNNVSLVAVSFYVVLRMVRNNYEKDEVLQIYVNAGLIQGLIAIMCFISPNIKSTLNTLMSTNSNSEKIVRTLHVTSGFRNYGFASSLYDIFGFAMSLLAIIALVQAFNGRKKNYLYFIVIAFAAVMNARTSIILIAVGFIVVYVFSGDNKSGKKRIGRTLFFVIAIMITVYTLVNNLLGADSKSATWLMGGYNEIKTLIFNHQAIGYFDTLFNKFLFLPDNLFSIFVGTGLTPMQAIFRNSDVGYIQNIWQYGLLGSIILYYTYIYILKKMKITLDYGYKGLSICFIILIVIYLIKLNCLGYSMGAVIYLPLAFYCIYRNYLKNSI